MIPAREYQRLEKSISICSLLIVDHFKIQAYCINESKSAQTSAGNLEVGAVNDLMIHVTLPPCWADHSGSPEEAAVADVCLNWRQVNALKGL